MELIIECRYEGANVNHNVERVGEAEQGEEEEEEEEPDRVPPEFRVHRLRKHDASNQLALHSLKAYKYRTEISLPIKYHQIIKCEAELQSSTQ